MLKIIKDLDEFWLDQVLLLVHVEIWRLNMKEHYAQKKIVLWLLI